MKQPDDAAQAGDGAAADRRHLPGLPHAQEHPQHLRPLQDWPPGGRTTKYNQIQPNYN